MPRLKRRETEAIIPLLLKVPEAGRLLNISDRHVDNLVDRGLLEKIHLGEAVRITRASVEKLANARKGKPNAG